MSIKFLLLWGGFWGGGGEEPILFLWARGFSEKKQGKEDQGKFLSAEAAREPRGMLTLSWR